MKTTKLKKTLLGLALVLGATTILSSCSKDDDDNNENVEVQSHVKIANASEGSASQELYLNNTKANVNAVAYGESSGYTTVSSGNRTAEFKSSGSTTVNSTANVNFEAGKYYTLYYTGGASASASYVTEDNLTAPSNGKAKIRFVHLSTAASNIDVAVQGAQNIVNSLSYKMASAFNEVNAASKFNLLTSGSASVILALNDINIQAGKIYTIYISGSSVASIKFNVIVHN